jgi:V-type H+-transporting ATPase subunit d
VRIWKVHSTYIDFKLQLGTTDYGSILHNETKPTTMIISQKCMEKFVTDFRYLRNQANDPLAKFFEYITLGYMIDNVILLITGALHERDTNEIISKCHPLGKFDSMAALSVSTNITDLFNSVLVETPLAPYFKNCLSAQDLDDMNIEIIRNSLYKAYLEDFMQFCETIGSCEEMKEILSFEADRRTINITINSFNTELGKDERMKLYPKFGSLYPEGQSKLSRVDEVDQVRAICESYPSLSSLFDLGEKTLEDKMLEKEVELNKYVFESLAQYTAFYSYARLKEQEIRNIVWIAECISQKQKEKIGNFIQMELDKPDSLVESTDNQGIGVF